MATSHTRACSATDALPGPHARSLSSNKTITSIPPNLLPSAPASPPTPAPSPTPHQRPPTWQSTDEDDEAFLLNNRIHFSSLPNFKRQKFLEGLLSLCDSQLLSFVSSYVGPRLRKDPFLVFPTELCLRVLSFIDDPKTLARASQVSRRWRELLNDDITWKNLCEKHAYASRRSSDDGQEFVDPFHAQYMHAISNQGVVTSLHLTPKYIVVALDNAKIHVYDTNGDNQKTLQGHVMGVWAMVPWDDILVSGGCDREVRVWNMATGAGIFLLRGHTSTLSPEAMILLLAFGVSPKGGVYGLFQATLVKYTQSPSMAGESQQVVWTPVLAAHDNSVTSLQFDSTRIVSGGSDGRVKVWSLQTGQLLRELSSPAEAVWRVAFEEEKAVIMASRSGRTVMEVWTFSPPPEEDSDDSVLRSSSSTPGILPEDDYRPRAYLSDPAISLGTDDDQMMPDAPSS
ncbi:hypothetical protein BBP40_007079 [Aspergillus hancockii]|nr:hypothetical protein BBP40_007079 [Aspergillus hancockii]